MHWKPESQQSAEVLHFSNSFEQPAGGGTQTRPLPDCRQKPLQHSSPDLQSVPSD
jgi:hypothetical protein